ncbi:MAG TPA: hypothetical protein PKH77_05175 [Anaerolineae bacterium]|nr:hypothetical protein [Anaerolineae bacterium]
MALSDLERLRLQIQDRPRLALRESLDVGDGITTTFLTQLHPVLDGSETVLVNGVPQVAGINYTFTYALGAIEFVVAPGSGHPVVCTYQWAAFSDAELEDLLEQYATVRRAAIAALEILLADTERFIKYTFGQESVDRSATREGLERLLDRLERSAAGPVVIVKADTPCREALLEPFVEQGFTCD